MILFFYASISSFGSRELDFARVWLINGWNRAGGARKLDNGTDIPPS